MRFGCFPTFCVLCAELFLHVLLGIHMFVSERATTKPNEAEILLEGLLWVPASGYPCGVDDVVGTISWVSAIAPGSSTPRVTRPRVSGHQAATLSTQSCWSIKASRHASFSFVVGYPQGGLNQVITYSTSPRFLVDFPRPWWCSHCTLISLDFP